MTVVSSLRQRATVSLILLRVIARSRIHVGVLSSFAVIIAACVVSVDLATGEEARSFAALSLFLSSLAMNVVAAATALVVVESSMRGAAAEQLLTRDRANSYLVVSGIVALQIAVVLCGCVFGALLLCVSRVVVPFPGIQLLVGMSSAVIEAMIVGQLVFALRLRLGRAVTLAVAPAWWLLGRLDGLIEDMVTRGMFGASAFVMRFVVYFIPRLGTIDLMSASTDGPVSSERIQLTLSLGSLYIFSYMVLAMLLFRRRLER